MYIEGLKALAFLALAVTTISVTITRAEVFAPLRQWLSQRNLWLGKLFGCSYCLSHWVSFLLVTIYQPVVLRSTFWIVDWLISAFALVTLATPVIWLVYRAYQTMVPENNVEVSLLREALEKAKEKILAQEEQIKNLSKAK